MKPDWKRFVDDLMMGIRKNSKTTWGKNELVEYLKDEKLKFLEKAVDPNMDDDIPF